VHLKADKLKMKIAGQASAALSGNFFN
jgi:hypothetical protein